MRVRFVDPKKVKFRMPKASTIGAIVLIFCTGFEFIDSWLRHASSAARHGIFFLVVIVVITTTYFVFTERK